jgi:hypothetical protein
MMFYAGEDVVAWLDEFGLGKAISNLVVSVPLILGR